MRSVFNYLVKPFWKLFEIKETNKKSNFDSLPDEILFEIFSYLKGLDLKQSSLVNSSWKKVTTFQNDLLWKRVICRTFAFGKEKWARHGIDTGLEPPLPRNIVSILNMSCSFSPYQTIRQSFDLILVPQSVNNKLFKLEDFLEMVGTPKDDYQPTTIAITDKLSNELKNTFLPESRWILIGKEVILDTVNMNVNEQQNFLSQSSLGSEIKFDTPHLSEAILSIFIRCVNKGDKSFAIQTRCQEKIQDHPIVVTGFVNGFLKLSGLHQDSLKIGDGGEHDNSSSGIVAVCRFNT